MAHPRAAHGHATPEPFKTHACTKLRDKRLPVERTSTVAERAIHFHHREADILQGGAAFVIGLRLSSSHTLSKLPLRVERRLTI
ncbi:hypothetical protein KX729_29820 [Rhizobium sp. XQZ8]|uniref:hypothetical protein n=1 Tax=Rhizobium populisoli TaxID=2859785 RepID=UPI001CA5750D|nr:hypothetical protein [Rhizobium populisoli]MBW6425607.1 hypothetical protein [Rhizobium populisoli]